MTRRVQALDGLRGVAIAMVLAQHFFNAPLGGTGVDVFFVLSGYLITSILRADKDEGSYWKIFYARRVTRILPPYLIAICAALLLFTLPWHSLWPYLCFFGANIGSFLHFNQFGPLNVLWSLSVEEHFYFVWPLLVRTCSEKTLTRILCCVIVLEPLLRVAARGFFHVNWSAFYFLTPFHLDGLAWGSLASLLLSSPNARQKVQQILRPFLTVLSAAFVVSIVAFANFDSHASYPYILINYPLVAMTAAALLAWLVLHQHGTVAKLFSWRPLRFLGLISYGLYLYHLLAEVLLWNIGDHYGYQHHGRLAIISLPFAIGVAWVSYRFIETPIIEFGRRKAGAYKTLDAPVLTTP